MEFIKLSNLSSIHKEEILKLWNNEYPSKLNYQSLTDFEVYLKNLKQKSHILMVDERKNIRGWYFDFIRDQEKWFAIILDSKLQNKGFGTIIINLAKKKKKS